MAETDGRIKTRDSNSSNGLGGGGVVGMERSGGGCPTKAKGAVRELGQLMFKVPKGVRWGWGLEFIHAKGELNCGSPILGGRLWMEKCDLFLGGKRGRQKVAALRKNSV